MSKILIMVIIMSSLIEYYIFSYFKWIIINHPVNIWGLLINYIKNKKYTYSILIVIFLVLILLLFGITIHNILTKIFILGFFFEISLVSQLLSQKCLINHLKNIINNIYSNNLFVSKYYLTLIISRNITLMNEHEICSSSILSLIENYCDATFSPIFYYLIFGLPGLISFKLINTIDSIIGNFKCNDKIIGKFVSKLDDTINYFPSRILDLISTIILYIFNIKNKYFYFSIKNGLNHISINSNFSETIFAKILHVNLGGNRVYFNNILIRDWKFNKYGRNVIGYDIIKSIFLVNLINLVIFLILILLVLN